jgi:hypothetical protein
MLKAMACHDAWMHAAHGDCDVNVPLVIPAKVAETATRQRKFE